MKFLMLKISCCNECPYCQEHNETILECKKPGVPDFLVDTADGTQHRFNQLVIIKNNSDHFPIVSPPEWCPLVDCDDIY
jgi:hypothetical protein